MKLDQFNDAWMILSELPPTFEWSLPLLECYRDDAGSVLWERINVWSANASHLVTIDKIMGDQLEQYNAEVWDAIHSHESFLELLTKYRALGINIRLSMHSFPTVFKEDQ